MVEAIEGYDVRGRIYTAAAWVDDILVAVAESECEFEALQFVLEVAERRKKQPG